MNEKHVHVMGNEVKYLHPRLIELTQIASPEFAGGQPTRCYVDPRCIVLVVQGLGSFLKRKGMPAGSTETWPDQECTTVWLSGHYMQVLETPQEVARLRDGALEVPAELGVVSNLHNPLGG